MGARKPNEEMQMNTIEEDRGGERSLKIWLTFILLPFAVILLISFAWKQGKAIFSDAQSSFMDSSTAKQQSGMSAVDSHVNEMSVRDQLRQFEIEGRDLFGESHTWRLRGYSPDEDINVIIGNNPQHSKVTELWRNRANESNISQAEEAAEYYNHLRRYYSHVQWHIDKLELETDSIVGNLPDDAKLDSAFKADRTLQQTGFIIGDIDRANYLFETKVKPFFK